ncbi:MAG: DNA cytosine methyltransferase [Bacteroidales bacterium]|jgi:DNA (cytosine-5)-methyltransferase 1|nr:DNA cytosine methyltransferase [Bacteroidales bacterium]
MKKFRFIDLFCGIGGFHQAMSQLGGLCVFACDIDEDCRKTYELNYSIRPERDITKIDSSIIPEYDVLCAGFPCQAFSKAGKRLGFQDETKGTLFFDVERIMQQTRPKYALLENVRNLASHDGGNTWRVIHQHLVAIGYNVLCDPVIFSPHYIGIPQHRERVYIMCVRKDVGELPEFLFDKERLPVCNIDDIMQDDSEIYNIERYRLDTEKIELLNLWDEFVKNLKGDKLPSFPIWSDYLKPIVPNEDMERYPKWKINFIHKNNQLYESNKSFIDDWLPRARKHPLFFGAKAKLEWQAGQYSNPSIWDNILQFRPSGIRVKPGTYFPALVAITQTSIVGRRKRFLTLRECARLQSFPDSFQPDVIEAQAYKQFGNSVNVETVKLFAKYMFGDKTVLGKYSVQSSIKPINFLEVAKEFPEEIVINEQIENGLDVSKNLLISLVKNDTIDLLLDGSINVYYTGKKFPTTIKLNHLYYFMPYRKGKGIRDLYYIRVARVGSKHEVHPEADPKDLRLVFEIEFVKQLFSDYKPVRLAVWNTFTDTTLEKILDSYEA